MPAAVKACFTNHPADNTHNPILLMALKEKQNQFQKPSSVSPAIKSVILTNELQDENTSPLHNASSEQRPQSTFSFRSDALLSQSCQLDKTIRHVVLQQNEVRENQDREKAEANRAGADAPQVYSLWGGKVQDFLFQSCV